MRPTDEKYSRLATATQSVTSELAALCDLCLLALLVLTARGLSGVPGDKEGRVTSWVKKAIRWTQPEELSKVRGFLPHYSLVIDLRYAATQRKNEFSETAQRLVQSTFGALMFDMIEIRGLAVSTKRQRRGYGTALVDAIHAIVRGIQCRTRARELRRRRVDWPLRCSTLQADEQGKAVWLITSDAVGFYEAVGYTKIREQWIGTSNPAWSGPPVPVRIVSAFLRLLTLQVFMTTCFARRRW